MFTWDKSTPKTLSASSTNQLKVSLGVRAATLRTIEISAKSSRGTSPNRGMITVRGNDQKGKLCRGVPTNLWLDRNTTRMRRVEEFLR